MKRRNLFVVFAVICALVFLIGSFAVISTTRGKVKQKVLNATRVISPKIINLKKVPAEAKEAKDYHVKDIGVKIGTEEESSAGGEINPMLPSDSFGRENEYEVILSRYNDYEIPSFLQLSPPPGLPDPGGTRDRTENYRQKNLIENAADFIVAFTADTDYPEDKANALRWICEVLSEEYDEDHESNGNLTGDWLDIDGEEFAGACYWSNLLYTYVFMFIPTDDNKGDFTEYGDFTNALGRNGNKINSTGVVTGNELILKTNTETYNYLHEFWTFYDYRINVMTWHFPWPLEDITLTLYRWKLSKTNNASGYFGETAYFDRSDNKRNYTVVTFYPGDIIDSHMPLIYVGGSQRAWNSGSEETKWWAGEMKDSIEDFFRSRRSR